MTRETQYNSHFFLAPQPPYAARKVPSMPYASLATHKRHTAVLMQSQIVAVEFARSCFRFLCTLSCAYEFALDKRQIVRGAT